VRGDVHLCVVPRNQPAVEPDLVRPLHEADVVSLTSY
jgi:hypothetical protein